MNCKVRIPMVASTVLVRYDVKMKIRYISYISYRIMLTKVRNHEVFSPEPCIRRVVATCVPALIGVLDAEVTWLLDTMFTPMSLWV